MDGFHLLRPYWLLALLPLAGALYLLFRQRNRRTPWRQVVDAHLLKHLLVAKGGTRKRRPLFLLAVGWLLAVLALAGPAWQKLPPLEFKPDVPPLVILLDLSRSMNTRDLAPSRLRVAQAKLATLLERMPQRPVALVAFSATAHRVMPFTEDRNLIGDILHALSTDLMPAPGSRASAALLFAHAMLDSAQSRSADLLLVTDSVDKAAESAAKRLFDEGHRLSLLAVGTAKGGPVPDAAAGYLRGDLGVVTAALDGESLRRVADAGGGVFRRLARDDSDLSALLAGLGRPAGAAGFDQDQQASDPQESGRPTWRDGGPWLIFPLLPLALLLFRRGSLVVLVLAVGLSGRQAEAFEFADLWFTPDQRGWRLLQQNRHQEAARQFFDQRWRGVAAYRSGDYETALAAFSTDGSAVGHFNRGNALVALGRLQAALSAYDQALAQNPQFDDARFNRRLLLEALKPDESPLPSPSDASSDKQKGEQTPAETAEDLMQPPGGKDVDAESGTAPDDLSGRGTAGGGAMMLQGEEHAEMKSGSALGENADQGDGTSSGSQGIARQGGENAAGDGESTARQVVQGGAEAPATRDAPEISATADQQTPMSEAPAEAKFDNRAAAGEGEDVAQSERRDTLEDPDGRASDSESAAFGEDAESTQAMRHWIDGIEDDPTGLLKEKFLREYRRDPPAVTPEQSW